MVILGRVPGAAAGFTSSAVLPVLDIACARAGLASEGAELLRLGENAIFRLAGAPVVVRIARSADRLGRVEKELCVARWLAAAGVPAVRVYARVEQPILVEGHPVSFWHAVTGGEPKPAHVDLARLLAKFHQTPDCPCDLPGFDPLGTSFARLDMAAGVAPRDRDFLRDRCAVLDEQLRSMEFALPPGPVHGDAHTANLLADDGRVVLLDFEAAMNGPREWDLMPTAVARERLRLSEEKYRAFAGAYGYDVRDWAGYPVLREIRELTMTTWIMQITGESPAAAAEFALRVTSLRERDTSRGWNPF